MEINEIKLKTLKSVITLKSTIWETRVEGKLCTAYTHIFLKYRTFYILTIQFIELKKYFGLSSFSVYLTLAQIPLGYYNRLGIRLLLKKKTQIAPMFLFVNRVFKRAVIGFIGKLSRSFRDFP